MSDTKVKKKAINASLTIQEGTPTHEHYKTVEDYARSTAPFAKLDSATVLRCALMMAADRAVR